MNKPSWTYNMNYLSLPISKNLGVGSFYHCPPKQNNVNLRNSLKSLLFSLLLCYRYPNNPPNMYGNYSNFVNRRYLLCLQNSLG